MHSTRAGDQPYVFVSYASADRARVLPVIDALREAGVAVWLDQEAIPGGSSYGPEIVDGIVGCAALVVMCSEASFASTNVRQEIAIAWKYRRPYLPLLLEPVEIPREVEYWLEGAQWIEVLRHPIDIWLPKVLAALDRHCERSAPVTTPFQPATQPTNLPTAPTALVGRAMELDDVGHLVSTERLVTILGPGGTGKTRLSLAVAAELLPSFRHGAFFVDLTPISTVDLALPTIAATLGVQQSAGQSLSASLIDYLRAKHMLLVLDNLEHIIGVAAEISSLLAHCPNLHLLVTSRAPLRIGGEHEYPLAPLAVPAPDHLPPVADLVDYGAIRLFVERAQAIQPSFALTAENASTVAEICARLDGLPLAIELAASRIRLLTPESMLGRFERWLPALSGGARDRPSRHKTLRDAIAWSYDLLDDDQQHLFRALSVFRGGWTIDLAATATHADPLDVLAGLDALVSHSLARVIEQSGSDPRFALLETIREFGLEQLEALGESEQAAATHAAAVLQLVEEIAPRLSGPQQIETLDRIDSEHANIRAALDCFIGRQEVERASRLISPLWLFWWMRGHLSEGRGQYERVLSLPADTISTHVRAATLTGAGIMAEWTGDPDRAITLQHEAIAVWGSVPQEDQSSAHWSYACLGNIAVRDDRLDDATTHYQTMIDLGEQLDSDRARSSGWLSLGVVAHVRGDIERERECNELALTHARRSGDPWATSLAAFNLANAHLLAGDQALAQPLFIEAADISRRLNHRWHLLWLESMLGTVALDQGDADEAIRRFEATLQQASDIGESALRHNGTCAYAGLGEAHLLLRDTVAASAAFLSGLQLSEEIRSASEAAPLFVSISGLLIEQRRYIEAAQCLGAYHAMRTASGTAAAGQEAVKVEQRMNDVRANLPTAVFEDAYRSGRSLSLNEAIVAARRLLGD